MPHHRGQLRLVFRLAVIAVLGLGAAACASGHHEIAPYRQANLRSYEVGGKRYSPKVTKHYEEKGLASWYSYPAGTRRTADGEPFDPGRLTAAHKTLPLPCVVEVTNLENGKTVRVRVNDRGPFASGRIIDLSRAAADRLGFTRQGTARVKVKFLGPATSADSGDIMLASVDETAQPDAAFLF